MPELWQALDIACALQTLLSHGLTYRQGIGGIDVGERALEDLEAINQLFGLGSDDLGSRVQGKAAYVEELQRLRAGIVNVMRWMAWDDWHPLLGSESGGLYTLTKTRWNTLGQAYLAWFQLEAALQERA